MQKKEGLTIVLWQGLKKAIKKRAFEFGHTSMGAYIRWLILKDLNRQ